MAFGANRAELMPARVLLHTLGHPGPREDLFLYSVLRLVVGAVARRVGQSSDHASWCTGEQCLADTRTEREQRAASARTPSVRRPRKIETHARAFVL